jgi:tubulin alpha
VIPGGELAKTSKTGCLIANNSGISSMFKRTNQKFDKIYAKRAFVHWFVGEGMEEGEFSECRMNLEELFKEYQTILTDPTGTG